MDDEACLLDFKKEMLIRLLSGSARKDKFSIKNFSFSWMFFRLTKKADVFISDLMVDVFILTLRGISVGIPSAY